MPPATPPAPAPWPGLCLLLTVARPPAAGQLPGWHARVLLADGQLLDFDSPFELVRYLSRLPLPQADRSLAGHLSPGSGGPGLR